MQNGQNQQRSPSCPRIWEVQVRSSFLSQGNIYSFVSVEGLQSSKQVYCAHRLTISCRTPSQSCRNCTSYPTPRREAGVSWTREDTPSPAPPSQERVNSDREDRQSSSPRGASPPTGFLQGRERLGGLQARYAGWVCFLRRAQSQQAVGSEFGPQEPLG